MADNKIFRQKAVDRLSSPEQLHRSIAVISPGVWVAVVAGLAVLAIFIGWLFMGEMIISVPEIGIYLRGGNYEYVSYGFEPGIVEKYYVRQGDFLAAGAPLCDIVHADGTRTTVSMTKSGNIFKMTVGEGSYVSFGDKLTEFRSLTEYSDNMVFFFATLADSKQLRPGMKIYAVPGHMNPNHCGYITGRIDFVDTYISGSDDAFRLIGDERTASLLIKDEPMVQVGCALDEDPASANGFAWTKPAGRDVEMTDMTPMNIKVIISEDSPLNHLTGR